MAAPTTSPDFVLGALAYDVLWEHLDLGEAPLMVPVSSHGDSLSERRMLVESCWAELTSAGLVRGMEVEPRLAASLRVLSSPRWEITAVVRAPQQPKVHIMAGASNQRGVIAARDEQGLRLAVDGPTGLVRRLLETLPQYPAARGRSVSVPADALDVGQALSSSQVVDRLQQAGLSSSDARSFSEALRGDKYGLGKISAAARDYANQRNRASWAVTYLDTEGGRYSLVSKPAGDGKWTTVAPADSDRLHTLVAEMLDDAAGASENRLPSSKHLG